MSAVNSVSVQYRGSYNPLIRRQPDLSLNHWASLSLAGLGNSFKHHLALFKRENHVGLRVREVEGSASMVRLCRALDAGTSLLSDHRMPPETHYIPPAGSAVLRYS